MPTRSKSICRPRISDLEAVPFEAKHAKATEQGYALQCDAGIFEVTPVSMGNPHGVVFVEIVAEAPVNRGRLSVDRASSFSSRGEHRFLPGRRSKLSASEGSRTGSWGDSGLWIRCLCGCRCRLSTRPGWRPREGVAPGRQSPHRGGRAPYPSGRPSQSGLQRHCRPLTR